MMMTMIDYGNYESKTILIHLEKAMVVFVALVDSATEYNLMDQS
jgi:hypothetical protein